MNRWVFCQNRASHEEIVEHFNRCDPLFIASISERIALRTMPKNSGAGMAKRSLGKTTRSPDWWLPIITRSVSRIYYECFRFAGRSALRHG